MPLVPRLERPSGRRRVCPRQPVPGTPYAGVMPSVRERADPEPDRRLREVFHRLLAPVLHLYLRKEWTDVVPRIHQEVNHADDHCGRTETEKGTRRGL